MFSIFRATFQSWNQIMYLKEMFHQFSALQLFSTKDTGASQPLLLLLDVRSHLTHRPLRALAEQAVEGAVLCPAVHG